MKECSALLINPAAYASPLERISLYSFATTCIPLGIAYIAAVLRKNGISVGVIDQQAERLSNQELVNRIIELKPGIIAFSCLTFAMANTVSLINTILEKGLSGYIILGNVHADYFSKDILNEWREKVFIVHGEAEMSMLELVNRLLTKKPVDDVDGISFVSQNKIIRTPERKNIEDLDILPYPAYELFNLKAYKNSLAVLNTEEKCELPLLGSRGCPYSCIFCAQKFTHKTPRYRKELEIVNEIEFMYDKFNASYFGFYDAFFPFSKKSGINFCNTLIKKGLHKKIGWDTALCPEMADDELFKVMREAGAKRIFFGFESGNEEILKSINKHMKIADAFNAVKIARKNRLDVVGLFMLGLPKETKNTCRQTIDFAKKLDCDAAKFCFFVPFPGSLSFNLLAPGKISAPRYWAVYEKKRPYLPDGLNEKELNFMQWRALFEFYARPHKLIKSVLKGYLDFKKIMFMAKTMLRLFCRL